MPVTQSAKQVLRKDRRRTVVNIRRKRAVKQAVDAMKSEPTAKNLSKASSQIDRMVKYHLYHQNKAARLKSQLSRLLLLKKEASSKTSKARGSVKKAK